MSVFTRLSRTVHTHRKGVIIGGVVAGILLLAGGYALWSKHTWDGFETNYTTWQSETKQQADAALALPVKNEQDRGRKLTALKTVSVSVNSAKETLCKVSSLVQWQQSIDFLKKRVEACNKVIDGQFVFGSKLQVITSYLESEQALAKIIAKNSGPAQLTEGEWEAQIAVWQATAKSVTDMSTHTTFTSVKDAAVKQAKELEAAWKELVAAHKAKDKSRFIKAQSQLTSAYDAFAGVAVVSTQQLQKLVDQLPAQN